MSLAGAPVTAPISLAAASGRVLPRRLLALVADTLVISLLDAIVNGTFGVAHVTSGVATTMISGGFTSFTTQTTVDWPWLALLWVAYYIVLEGLFGATLGKLLAGLRVTDLEGRRLTRQAAILRNVARLLDVLPVLYLLGGILTLTSQQHQRLGDRLARTLVLPASAMISPPLPLHVPRRRALGLAAATAFVLAPRLPLGCLQRRDQTIILLRPADRHPDVLGQRRSGGEGTDDQPTLEERRRGRTAGPHQQEVGGRVADLEIEREQCAMQTCPFVFDLPHPLLQTITIA